MEEQYKNHGSITIRTIEECSELIHILCKKERFGMYSYNPNVFTGYNKDLILSEIDDVRKMLVELENEVNNAEKI